MANKIDIAVPCATVDNRNRANRAIDGVCSRNVHAVGRPGATAEVGRQRGVGEGSRNSLVQDKVVHLIVRSRIRGGGGKAENADGTVITGCREVLVRRVERDALDMTLVHGNRLQLLKRMARPNNDLGVQSDGNQYRRIVGPSQILHIVVVPD